MREREERIYKRMEQRNCKERWRVINEMRGNDKEGRIPDKVQDEKGNMTKDMEEAMKVWKRHFERIGKMEKKDSKYDEQEEKGVNAFVEMIENEDKRLHKERKYNKKITIDEVRKAMRMCVNGKATGLDNIKNEFMKNGGEEMRKTLVIIMNKIWDEEKVPTEWLLATITPIHKQGNKNITNNYRPISLTSVVGKLFEKVITDRITEWLEESGLLVEEQGGFRKGRGCMDQIWTLNEIVQSRREKRKHTYMAFIDFTKAYDMVWRNGMFMHLWKADIKGKVWRVIKSMYAAVRSCVSVNGHLSEWWDSDIGTRQGSVLSPILFSIFINNAIDYMRSRGHGISMGKKKDKEIIPGLLFADDLVLLSDSESGLRAAIRALEEWTKKWRMVVNNSKCGVIVAGESKKKQEEKKREWKINGEIVKEVDSYKYLGIEQEKMKGWKKYVERMIKKARRRIGELQMIGMKQTETIHWKKVDRGTTTSITGIRL